MNAHNLIKHHQINSLSSLLNTHITHPNDIDENDQWTLLQSTANNGLLQPTLELLYAGAEPDLTTKKNKKSPLYLAIENGHYLLADILFACGASAKQVEALALRHRNQEVFMRAKNLKCDSNILLGIIMWQISHYQETYQVHLFELIQPWFNRTSNHLEKEEKIFDPSGMSEINNPLVDILKDDLSGLLAIVPWSCTHLINQFKLLGIQYSRPPSLHIEMEEDKQNDILFFIDAFKKKNYLALSFLQKEFSFQHLLWKTILTRREFEFAKFLIIAFPMDPFHIALNFSHDPDTLTNLCNFLGFKGLLQSVISHSVQPDNLPSFQMRQLFQFLKPENQVTTEIIIQCLHRLNPSFPSVHFTSTLAGIAITKELNSDIRKKIASLLKRFNIPFVGTNIEKFLLPPPLISLVISYAFPPDELKNLIIDPAFYDIALLTSSGITRTYLSRLNKQIGALEEFINSVNSISPRTLTCAEKSYTAFYTLQYIILGLGISGYATNNDSSLDTTLILTTEFSAISIITTNLLSFISPCDGSLRPYYYPDSNHVGNHRLNQYKSIHSAAQKMFSCMREEETFAQINRYSLIKTILFTAQNCLIKKRNQQYQCIAELNASRIDEPSIDDSITIDMHASESQPELAGEEKSPELKKSFRIATNNTSIISHSLVASRRPTEVSKWTYSLNKWITHAEAKEAARMQLIELSKNYWGKYPLPMKLKMPNDSEVSILQHALNIKDHELFNALKTRPEAKAHLERLMMDPGTKAQIETLIKQQEIQVSITSERGTNRLAR